MLFTTSNPVVTVKQLFSSLNFRIFWPPTQPTSFKKDSFQWGNKRLKKMSASSINRASKIGVVDLPLASKEVLRLTWLQTSHVKFTGSIILMRSYNKYTYIRYMWLCAACGSIAWYMTAFVQSLLKGSILFHFVGQHMVSMDSSKHNDQTVLNKSRWVAGTHHPCQCYSSAPP